MITLQNISYVRLGTRDLEGSSYFASNYLGLEVSEHRRDTIRFRSDARDHTLCYFAGDPADQTVGFEVRHAADLDDATAALDKLGYYVRRGTAGEATERQVHSFIAFNDPSGNRIELVWRPANLGKRYRAIRDAGITGFSHVGLFSSDVVRDEKFWTNVCNARVSDRIGEAPLLRITEVHHAIALFSSDHGGIQHINHQVESGDDIIRSYNFLKERGVRIVFGPGRHPTSSARFLYFEGPDGMVFEYSSGVRAIADELLYRERQFPSEPRSFCYWGAKPQIRQFQSE